MMDLINQGKGSVTKIWQTSNFRLLQSIYYSCKHDDIDFYNPPEEYRNQLIDKIVRCVNGNSISQRTK